MLKPMKNTNINSPSGHKPGAAPLPALAEATHNKPSCTTAIRPMEIKKAVRN
jgi:hypothetical protein